MPDQTCFSPAALDLTTKLLLLLTGAITVLFGAVMKLMWDQILYQRELINQSIKVGEGQNEVAKELVQTARNDHADPPEKPMSFWEMVRWLLQGAGLMEPEARRLRVLKYEVERRKREAAALRRAEESQRGKQGDR